MSRLSVRVASALLLAACACGCGRTEIRRVEWPTMGTVAALQVKTRARAFDGERAKSVLAQARRACDEIVRKFDAHDATSELCRLAPLDESAILTAASASYVCSLSVEPCYRAAFRLASASGGAFNPRWRGQGTLDFGAIAKGFAVDVLADCLYWDDGVEQLVDVGGNLKCVRGTWKTGVKDPLGDGLAATVELRAGEALATSATYYRGSHIYDGRTGRPVTNGVASVTVRCPSALWADGLSTTLFILGPEDGRVFLDREAGTLPFPREKLAVLWILDSGEIRHYGDAAAFRL